jgi:hypothetical protein
MAEGILAGLLRRQSAAMAGDKKRRLAQPVEGPPPVVYPVTAQTEFDAPPDELEMSGPDAFGAPAVDARRIAPPAFAPLAASAPILLENTEFAPAEEAETSVDNGGPRGVLARALRANRFRRDDGAPVRVALADGADPLAAEIEFNRRAQTNPVNNINGRFKSALAAGGLSFLRGLARSGGDLAEAVGDGLGGLAAGAFRPETDERIKREGLIADSNQRLARLSNLRNLENADALAGLRRQKTALDIAGAGQRIEESEDRIANRALTRAERAQKAKTDTVNFLRTAEVKAVTESLRHLSALDAQNPAHRELMARARAVGIDVEPETFNKGKGAIWAGGYLVRPDAYGRYGNVLDDNTGEPVVDESRVPVTINGLNVTPGQALNAQVQGQNQVYQAGVRDAGTQDDYNRQKQQFDNQKATLQGQITEADTEIGGVEARMRELAAAAAQPGANLTAIQREAGELRQRHQEATAKKQRIQTQLGGLRPPAAPVERPAPPPPPKVRARNGKYSESEVRRIAIEQGKDPDAVVQAARAKGLIE